MTDLIKTFPYFVIWFDRGEVLPCEGTSHARTLDEANMLARNRTLFGSLESFASVYKGAHDGQAKLLHTFRWIDLEIQITKR